MAPGQPRRRRPASRRRRPKTRPEIAYRAPFDAPFTAFERGEWAASNRGGLASRGGRSCALRRRQAAARLGSRREQRYGRAFDELRAQAAPTHHYERDGVLGRARRARERAARRPWRTAEHGTAAARLRATGRDRGDRKAGRGAHRPCRCATRAREGLAGAK